MWIVIDGPEKAGKSTLARAICLLVADRGGSVYRHFSGSDPVTTEAIQAAYDQLDATPVLVWDRSWASGEVYQSLGVPQLPIAVLAGGEGLAAPLRPLRVMLIGPDAETLAAKRTPDDLPIDPAVERRAFQQYARTHGWSTVANPHEPGMTEALAEYVLNGGIDR